MKRTISINKSILILQSILILSLFIMIGYFLSQYLDQIRTQYNQNLDFRSSLFRKSITSDVIMGDYSSVLDKAEAFFGQPDVTTVKIWLSDQSLIANLQKKTADKSGNNGLSFRGSVAIESHVRKTQTPVAYIEIGYSLSSLNVLEDRLMHQSLIATALVLCIAFLAIFYFSRLLNRPLKYLSLAVSSGNLRTISSIETRSPVTELMILERSISGMGLQIIELNEREKENAKNAAVGRIISQISHDMRAPLGAFERLLSFPSDVTISSKSVLIYEALGRLNAMIESLRYADLELLIKPKLCEIDFRPPLRDFEVKAIERGINIRLKTAGVKGKLYVDSIKFERAWLNLVSNAIDFAKSEVHVEVEPVEKDLVLRIVDDGPGVAEELLSRLFQRGATHGKSDGTGLGLAYVRQIMRGHGGDVTYRRENNLTIFECRLPNAVEPEKEQVVENAASLEPQLVQKLVQSVAICLEPKALTQSILAKLASFDSGDFLFTEERNGARIVVSNIDEVMFEVLERDDQEFMAVAHLKGDERAIMNVMKRKFRLDIEGGARV